MENKRTPPVFVSAKTKESLFRLQGMLTRNAVRPTLGDIIGTLVEKEVLRMNG